MNFNEKTKKLLIQSMKIGLRTIAWISSFVLLMVLFVVLIATHPNVLKPLVEKIAVDRFDGELGFDDLYFRWVDETAVVGIRNLTARRDTGQGWLDLTVDRIDARISLSLMDLSSWEVARLDIVYPRVEFSRSRNDQPRQRPRQSDTDYTETIPASLELLSHIGHLNIIDGEYEFKFDIGSNQLDFTGGFDLQGASEGIAKFGVLRMTSNESENMIVNLSAASTEEADGSSETDMELIVKAVEVARLAPILDNIPRIETLNLAALNSTVNATVNAHWTDSKLAGLAFSVSAADPNLDGNIPDVRQASLTVAGTLKLSESSDSKRIEADFALNSLDMAAVMARIPGAFPEKFYSHVSERLDALWLNGLRGTLTIDSESLLDATSDWDLNAEGSFSNLTYRFGNRWPPLDRLSGTYRISGRQVEITASDGRLHGHPLSYGVAVIDDFMLEDPLMKVSAGMKLPFDVAIDLFGKDGIVSPGRLNWIVGGVGDGAVELTVDVPLRRGKEFAVAGHVDITEMEVLTTQEVWLANVAGRLMFNRFGITSGDLSGRMLGGPFDTQFKGTGGKGNFKATGRASGRANAQALQLVVEGAITERLSGDIDWQADYRFSSQENEINVTSTLNNLISTLPFPMRKGVGEELSANLTVLTKNQNERTIDLSLGPNVNATVLAELNEEKWRTVSAAVSVGESSVPNVVGRGMSVAVDLPQLDYGAWSELLQATSVSGSNIETSATLSSLSVKADELILPGNYELRNADIVVQKKASHWDIALSSESVKGSARYLSSEFVQQNQTPTLYLDLSLCHLDPVEDKPKKAPTDPALLPVIEFQCDDTRYGQYHLGTSAITAMPNGNSWRISSAAFNRPSFSIQASGDWYYDQSSRIEFNLNSNDFGQTMSVLGYSGLFEKGDASLTGVLEWDAALTRWATHRVSGKVELSSNGGQVIGHSNSQALRVIGALNYDTLFRKFSHDVVDVFDKKGILYDQLSGTARLEKGVFLIDGIYLEGPSVSMAITGESDWNVRRHQLKLGVEPQIKNSLTTLATVLINPITGTLVYFGSKLAEQMDIRFTYRYDITGSWSNPEIERIRASKTGSLQTVGKS